ncbi:MgtC/SapB family protein [Gammaproteobacteria bacterium]|nr:MgtC/SapB family protein [Gammaproteobacteria bacterium]
MININLNMDLEITIRVFIALILGCLLGYERERHGISAGIRTYGAICLGSCVFGVLSITITNADPARIAAQVATGMGFICGGVIFRDGSRVNGLTTAATIWATAAIGLAVSVGMYLVSIITTALVYFLLYSPNIKWWKKISPKVKSKKFP